MRAPILRALLLVAEAVFWAGASFGVWLLSLSAVSGQELLVAGPSACGCGALAVLARRAMRVAWHPSPDQLRGAWRVPLAIPVDAARVVAAALARRPGRFVQVPVRGATGDEPRPAARRAVTGFLLSLTPGSYLVDVDPANGRALVHELPGEGLRTTEALTR